MDKVYFYDLDIRNAILDNFSPSAARNDVRALWERFLVAEHRKRNAYALSPALPYYWRTYTGAELDCVEDIEQFSG